MTALLAVLAVLAVLAAAVPLVSGLVRVSTWLADRGPLPTAWIGEVEAYANGVRL